MDNSLIRFYNQHRWIFWLVIITIIAGIVLIHVIDSFLEKKDKETISINQNNQTYDIKNDENYSVYTGKKVDEAATNIIHIFINLCNEGKIKEAYALLSDDCKEILYPSIEDFNNKYYSRLFDTKKLFKVQALEMNNNITTYQINYTEDILATGKIAKTSIVDYYTIVKDKNRNTKVEYK